MKAMGHAEEMDSAATWHQLLPGSGQQSRHTSVEIQSSGSGNCNKEDKNVSGGLLRVPQWLKGHPEHLNNFPTRTKNSEQNKHSLTSNRYRQNRLCSRRVRKRVVFKNGDCNIVQTNMAKRRRKYLADFFTTLVDCKWRWTLLLFTASFVLSWLAFATVWWLIALTHGDFEPDHLPDKQESSGWTPCVINIHSFTSCFLYSIETQHTIGYGSRYPTEECPEAIFVMCLQSLIGVMIQAMMVGVVFSKLIRPKMRAQTLLFSRNAVICQRDGQLCLMFRVGDMRKSHIISASIRAQLIRSRVSLENEHLPFFQYELKVGVDHDDHDVFFIWPMTIVHKITPDSPLYNLSASDLLKEKFEIVVILEGTIESTSMTTQARSSYLPSEILWGHRFEPMVSFRKDTGQYAVDYSLFNHTYEVDTPLCSSQELDEVRSLHMEPHTVSRSVNPRRSPIHHYRGFGHNTTNHHEQPIVIISGPENVQN